MGQLALLVQHIGLGSDADEGAQRVEQVNEEEGEHDGEEVQDAHAGEVGLEHLPEGLAQCGEVEADKAGGDDGVHPCVGVGDINASQLADDAEHPCDEDAVEDAALDVLHQQDGGDDHAQQSEDGAHAHRGEGLALKVLVGDEGGVAVDDELGILQAHEGHEQADAHADSALEGHGDGVEDALTHVGQAQHDEDDALDEDGHQGQLPAVAHRENDGVGKVGVQAHAGGQREGVVGQQSHQGSAHEGCQRGGDQDCVGIHAGSGKDAGVDRKDVGHRHEGGDTGHDFGLDVGVVLFQVKDFFEHESSSCLCVKLPPPASSRERTKPIVARTSDICPPEKYKKVTFLQKMMNEYDSWSTYSGERI